MSVRGSREDAARVAVEVKSQVALTLVDAVKASGSQLVIRAENELNICLLRGNFGDLGVVLNASTNKRDGLEFY